MVTSKYASYFNDRSKQLKAAIKQAKAVGKSELIVLVGLTELGKRDAAGWNSTSYVMADGTISGAMAHGKALANKVKELLEQVDDTYKMTISKDCSLVIYRLHGPVPKTEAQPAIEPVVEKAA